MFRQPRENTESKPNVVPSVGRAPTPPLAPFKTPFTLAVPPDVPAPTRTMATKTRSNKAVPLPTIGKQGFVGSAKKAVGATPKGKLGGKGNGNIMSFFKKSEDVGLFVEGHQPPSSQDVGNALLDAVGEPVAGEEEDEFVGSERPAKRQRTDSDDERLSAKDDESKVDSVRAVRTKIGPFAEDSDSDEESEQLRAVPLVSQPREFALTAHIQSEPTRQLDESAGTESAAPDEGHDAVAMPPTLIKQETSFAPDDNDFEGLEDFDEDLFEEGDETLERRYMEEQASLEAEQDQEKDYDSMPSDPEAPVVMSEEVAQAGGSTCPICSISLGAASEKDAGVHVNNCLDGNPTPLPPRKLALPAARSLIKAESSSMAAVNAIQYKRPVRAPRPGQANPFTFGQPPAAANKPAGSAFNTLMSGHAEDAAWAEAAAAEQSSRGKPSYQRTCPFYKIMPGLSICVDAFRYGAVAGCKAYFLSHFHSDHYIGLTSTWTHGPIYCSHVTANLVRNQLRVDPKYVFDLDFDATIDVPGTKGVKVTMINANHCPGSSLFLFESATGQKQKNGEPRLHRILHCGDFRACRAHVQHPLLMPNVQDRLTGKLREQKIDVCYLDTTYLNPKYAFPEQVSVITACADMCVSLSRHTVDEGDGWEQMKRTRAGDGMVKFVQRESSIKQEPVDENEAEDDKSEMKLLANPHDSQQRLRTSSTPDVKSGRGRLLVIVGTYSIGKERICVGIAHALNSLIYAPPQKQKIIAALEDPELNALMTTDPYKAQIHMTPLFEIRAETLDDYLKDYYPHFTRAVGFRPSGWNYRPPTSRFLESPSVHTVLHGDNWKSNFSMKELVPQRGSTSRASCFGVPYSEHSSFRELTMFCCALRIEKIIPTVNVGSAKGRGKMKDWCERWAAERKKNGLYELPADGSW